MNEHRKPAPTFLEIEAAMREQKEKMARMQPRPQISGQRGWDDGCFGITEGVR